MRGGIRGALHISMTPKHAEPCSFLLLPWLPAAVSVLHLEIGMWVRLAAAICCISCLGGP
jgi:hypothetical protein